MPAFCAVGCVSLVSMAAEPVDIGSRRELFVDDHVIEKIEGDVRLDMTTYGVEPPTVMLGMMRVRPQIRIEFSGVVTP